MRRVIVTYVAFLALGGIIGAVVAHGSAAARLVGVFVGLFVAMVVAVLAVQVLRVGLSIRTLTKSPDKRKRSA